MPQPDPRRAPLAALMTACVLIATLVGGATATAAPSATDLRAAETRVLERINAERARRDLRPIRMDGRIQAIARARSADMAERAYFAHVDPDGNEPWDHLNSEGISWYRAGEIIARNHVTSIATAAGAAVQQWMGSPPHRSQIVSASFNYAGVGAAVDGSGTGYWTVVFIQGPDRTSPQTRLTSVSRIRGRRAARVRWSGTDPRLVTGTAGIASYDIQRRRAGGSWTIVRHRVTGAAASIGGTRGVRYQFRVRARDKAGNVGAWSSVRSVVIR